MTSVALIENNHDFSDGTVAAEDKVEAAALDAQLSNVKNKINAFLAAVGLVIRDDDTLVDEIVRLRNLHPEITAIIAANDAWLPKVSVACASTANLALTGEQTIDGVLTAASRVLVKNQTAGAENGIYVTGAGAWTRATDADTAAELGLAAVLVLAGTQNANSAWVQTVVAASLTLDTTALVWAQFAGQPGITPVAKGGTGQVAIAAWPVPHRMPVRAAATVSTNLAAPGATIDGVAMAAGDRVLLTAQATASQNGIWQWNGAAAAMTRPLDYAAASTVQAYANVVVTATEGTANAGSSWRLTTTGAITIDTTDTAWLVIPVSAGPVKATGTTTARTLEARFAQVFDVQDFGAKFDGATDDATAINAAITAANAAGGGTVVMPFGTGRLGAKLTMKASVRLVGAGWATTLKPTDASADAVNPVVLFRNITKAEARDFAIDGNAAGLTQAVGHAAIRMAGCSDCVVDRIRVSDCGKTAISPAGEQILITAFETLDGTATAQDIAGTESRRNRVSNCLLEDASAKSQMGIRVFTNWLYDVAETAFAVLNADNVIENNYLIGFEFNGIEICGPAAKFNLVRGNTLIGHLGFSGIEADKGASYNRYIGNSVRGTLGNASDYTSLMRCQGGVSASFNRYARGNLFTGNILSGLGTAYSGSVGFLFSRAYDNQFIDNVVDVTQDAGVSHGVMIADRVSGAIIAENRIRGITGNGDGVSNQTYQANLAENMSNIEIRDNQIDSPYNGILLSNIDAGAFTLSDLRVVDNRISGGTSNKAINLSTGTSDADVIGNRISAPTGDALYTNGAKVNFRHNIIVGQTAGVAVYLAASATGASIIGNITRTRTSVDNAYRNDSAETPFLDSNWFEGTVAADSVGPKIFHDTAAPIAGTWRRADQVWNITPSSGGPPGWVCTAGGTPGTWKAMANLA